MRSLLQHTFVLSLVLLGCVALAPAQVSPAGPNPGPERQRRQQRKQDASCGKCPLAAAADQAGPRLERIFKALDSDGDGKIDMTEMSRNAPGLLKRLQAEGPAAEPGPAPTGPETRVQPAPQGNPGGPALRGQGRGARRGGCGMMRGGDAMMPGGGRGVGAQPGAMRDDDRGMGKGDRGMAQGRRGMGRQQMQAERFAWGGPACQCPCRGAGRGWGAGRGQFRGQSDGQGGGWDQGCPLAERGQGRGYGWNQGGPAAFQPFGRDFAGRGRGLPGRGLGRGYSGGPQARGMLGAGSDDRLDPQEIRRKIEALERLLERSEREAAGRPRVGPVD